MILSWFKKRRRARILAAPFPESWNELIRDNVVHDRCLIRKQQQKLRRLVQIFVAEKNWEGCGGLTMTDEIKVTIAAQACLMVVGMDEDLYFDHVLTSQRSSSRRAANCRAIGVKPIPPRSDSDFMIRSVTSASSSWPGFRPCHAERSIGFP